MAEAFQACRAASQSISVASNGGRGSQEAADACSPRRRAIRRRHSAVDEGRGGRVVARHIDGVQIKQGPYTRFLGVIVDEKISWAHHVSSITSKLSSGLYSLRSVKNILNPTTKRSVYMANI